MPTRSTRGALLLVDDVAAVAGDPQDVHAARWVAVAVRCLDLVLLVAGFVALVALVRLVAGGVAVAPLQGFAFAGRGARRHQGQALGAVVGGGAEDALGRHHSHDQGAIAFVVVDVKHLQHVKNNPQQLS